MGIFRKRAAKPDPDGPWTVVFATRVPVGIHLEQRWHWHGSWVAATREEAHAFAQRLQEDLARRGRKDPVWAYARVEDAQKLLEPVEVPNVIQWPAERWAEV